LETKLDAGSLVAGRYRLERILGEGGMGVVWAATHVLTRKRVALKLVKRAASVDQRTRLLREARASCAVRHPHVREVYDVLETDDGAPVMVMEYLAGESLAERIGREGKLALPEAAALLLPVVSAVGAAHALGIVHRDLKPENIFLDEGPPARVKVLDFGIAKLTAREGAAAETAALTASGTLLGTPYYMSPEQAFGERDVDHRTDVWALGLILYRCLSGVLPTQADNVGQVFKSIVARPIRPLAEAAPDLPSDVATLVDRMLSRGRRHRPDDLHEVVEVLERHTDARAPAFGRVTPSGPEADDAAKAAGEPPVDGMASMDPLADTEAPEVGGTTHAGMEGRGLSDSGEAGSVEAPAKAAGPAPWRWRAAAGALLGLGAVALYAVVQPAVKAPSPASQGLAPSVATAIVPPSSAAPATPIPEASSAVSSARAPEQAPSSAPPRRPAASAKRPTPAPIPKPPEPHEEDALRRPE
jgi:tRNA A-37 threonylcarbamoyl transferase component Bud32